MTVRNDVASRILGSMSGGELIRFLLRSAGYQRLADFGASAFDPPRNAQQVSYCINGDRSYPQIRDRLAEVLELSREEIDHLIDGPSLPAAEAS